MVRFIEYWINQSESDISTAMEDYLKNVFCHQNQSLIPLDDKTKSEILNIMGSEDENDHKLGIEMLRGFDLPNHIDWINNSEKVFSYILTGFENEK